MESLAKIIKDYPLEYCRSLEAAYGHGMMSEGGPEAIEKLFHGIDINGKRALDVGAGLGGTAHYLAEQHAMNVIGLEINPDMVAEARQRIPKHLQNQLDFIVYDDIHSLPFNDNCFDIIYSKGVFAHLDQKLPLFKELYRLLEPKSGYFIVNDWLSPNDGHWGKRLQKLAEMEGLTMFAVSPQSYKYILNQAGFQVIQEEDETADYARYNLEIKRGLQDSQNATNFIKQFGKTSWEEAVEGYELIAQSMQDGELFVKRYVCQTAS